MRDCGFGVKLSEHDQHQVDLFISVLRKLGDPPLTVMDMLRMTPEERDFCVPGTGPMDLACYYCPGMGV